MGRAIGLIAAAPAAVIRTLMAVDRYRQFLPRIRQSVITRAGRKSSEAYIKTNLPWPAADAWTYFRFAHYPIKGGGYEMRFSQTKSSLKQCAGWARAAPWRGNRHRTLLSFTMLVEPKGFVPIALLRGSTKRLAVSYVNRMRKRIGQQKAQQGKPRPRKKR